MMKRIKRFVLAENSEKDPIWKSSDNLNSPGLLPLSRMSSFEAATATASSSSEQLVEVEEPPRAEPLAASELHPRLQRRLQQTGGMT